MGRSPFVRPGYRKVSSLAEVIPMRPQVVPADEPAPPPSLFDDPRSGIERVRAILADHEEKAEAPSTVSSEPASQTPSRLHV